MRGELETEQKLQHIAPSSSGYNSASFSSCGAAQQGALRAQLSTGSGSHCFDLQQMTPNSDLQLPIASGYIIVWRTSASVSVTSALNSPVHSQGYPQINRPDAPVIYTGTFLIWQLGRVEGQYVKIWVQIIFIKIVSWSYNYLRRIIIMSYLKSYNYPQEWLTLESDNPTSVNMP